MGPAALMLAITLAAPVRQHDHKAAMDHRGGVAMGFDQARARHTFTKTDDGGVVAIEALARTDSGTIQQIRTHLAEIAKLFKAGDFSKPLFIHSETPPGADAMKTLKKDIEYRFEETALGGKLTIRSANRDAVAAVHEFLLFQGKEHK